MGSRASLSTHGQDLFKTKGASLPGYVREIARALMREQGMTKSRAIATAISRCKVWAAGGGGVNADTRAKAAAAVAEWEKAKATARATPNKGDRKFSNPLALSGVLVNLANAPAPPKAGEKKKAKGSKDTGGGKENGTGKQRYKHGWIPVDENGKPTGPAEPPAWLKKAKEAHKAAGGRSAEAIENEKAADEAKRKKDKAERPAKEAKRKKEAAARKAEAAAKKRKRERETAQNKATRVKKAAARESERKTNAKKRDDERKQRDRKQLLGRAAKQALADLKAGRQLTEQQQRVVAHVRAEAKKSESKLRKVDAPGTKVTTNLNAKKPAVAAPAKKKAAAAPKVSAAVKKRSFKNTDRRTRNGMKKRAYGSLTTALSNEGPGREDGGQAVLPFDLARLIELGVDWREVCVNAGVIDLANPKGLMAFRYKHGWILINPAIPSRGALGGALARKHGVKSGTATWGRFVNKPGGGKVFVPERSGKGPAQKVAELKIKANKAPQTKDAYTTAAQTKPTGPAKISVKQDSALLEKKQKEKTAVAQKASTKAFTSQEPEDMKAAGAAHADAFVAAKKAGNEDLAAKHKKAAQEWAKEQKAAKQKQAEQLKAQEELKEKLSDEYGEAYEKAQKTEKDAAGSGDPEKFQKAADAHKEAAEKGKKVDGLSSGAVDYHEKQASKYEGYSDAWKQKLKIQAEKEKAEQKKAAEAADAKKLYADAFNMPEGTPEEKEAKAKALGKAANALAPHTGDDTLMKAKYEQSVGMGSQLLKDAKAQKEAAEAAPSAPKMHELDQATQSAILEGWLSVPESQSGNVKEWKAFLYASHQVKTDPSKDNLSGMVKAKKALEAKGATSGDMQKANAAMFKEMKAGGGAKPPVTVSMPVPESKPVVVKAPPAPKFTKATGQLITHNADGEKDVVDVEGLSSPKGMLLVHKAHGSDKGYTVSGPTGLKLQSGFKTQKEAKAFAVWAESSEAGGPKKFTMDEWKKWKNDNPAAALKFTGKVTTGEWKDDTPSVSAPKSEPGPGVDMDALKAKYKISLPGPGMYADGNQIIAAETKYNAMPQGPDKVALGAAIQDAEDAFKAKHGLDFDSDKVEKSGASFMPDYAGGTVKTDTFFDAAKAAGFEPVATNASANGSWKPSDSGVKSNAGAYHYSGGSYGSINAQLRKYKSPVGGSNDAAIAQMDKEFAAVPGLDKDIVVVRRMSDKGPFPPIPPGAKPGDEFVDHGYSSTSKVSGMWSGSVVMEIRVRKGTKVLDLNHTTGSQHSSEKEILLNRDTKFKVVSDEKSGYERKIVLEVGP